MMKRTPLTLLITIGLCLLIGFAPVQARPQFVANPSLTISVAP